MIAKTVSPGRWIYRRSSRGEFHALWEPSIMARIPDEMIGCAFFLYPSHSDAEYGNAIGASGFFVGIDWAGTELRRHLYAVTNKHCILQCRDEVVIRATKSDGTLDYIESDPVDWHPSPTHDISVLPISPAKAALFRNISDGLFVTPTDFEPDANSTTCLGPGDDVFMIGRFTPHDRKATNHPSSRFGNLSMVVAPIKHPGGYDQESFAVEMRSISGYSGSPVFIYWGFGGNHLHGIKRSMVTSFLGLLGVDWGHIPMRLPVLNSQGNPLPNGEYVKSHTSMSGVVPAWRLKELLDSDRFKEQRMQDESSE